MLGFTKIFYPVLDSTLHHFIFILVVLCDETIKAIFCVVAKDMDVLFLGLILCYAHTSVHRDWTKTFFCQAFSNWHMTPALQHRFFMSAQSRFFLTPTMVFYFFETPFRSKNILPTMVKLFSVINSAIDQLSYYTPGC